MTKISINNQEIKNINRWNCVDDLVDHLLSEYVNPNEVLTEITINGKEFPISDDILARRVDTFQTICFHSRPSIDVTFEAIDSASSSIDTIISKIIGLCEAYSRSDIQKANKLFLEITEILDLFVQLISGIQSGLKIHRPHFFSAIR